MKRSGSSSRNWHWSLSHWQSELWKSKKWANQFVSQCTLEAALPMWCELYAPQFLLAYELPFRVWGPSRSEGLNPCRMRSISTNTKLLCWKKHAIWEDDCQKGAASRRCLFVVLSAAYLERTEWWRVKVFKNYLFVWMEKFRHNTKKWKSEWMAYQTVHPLPTK